MNFYKRVYCRVFQTAYLACVAFSKSYVGYIHAVAHSLGGQYNIPHGLANSVLMPIVLDGYGKKVYNKLKKLGISAGICEKEDDPKTGVVSGYDGQQRQSSQRFFGARVRAGHSTNFIRLKRENGREKATSVVFL